MDRQCLLQQNRFPASSLEAQTTYTTWSMRLSKSGDGFEIKTASNY